MKHPLSIIIVLFFNSLLSFSQTVDLGDLQGLRDENGDVELEIRGYTISVSHYKGNLDNMGTIKSIKGLFNLKTILAEYQEEKFKTANKIIECEQATGDEYETKRNRISYIFEKSEGELDVLLFQTLNQRDILLEQEIAGTYLANGLLPYISDEWNTSSINFAGKTIDLGTNCKWTAPRNIHCGGSQISWSEFLSFEDANFDINNRIKIDNGKNANIILEEDLEILFNNIPSLAHRVVYWKNDTLYPLIVYYIVQEVEGRFISCAAGNYGKDENDYELAPLLRKIISIPVVPESTPDDTQHNHHKGDKDDTGASKDDYDHFHFQARAGSWIPAGSLSKNFKAAPSVGIYIGGAIKEKFVLDFGVEFAVPVSRNDFLFIDDGYGYETETTLMVNIAVRLHHKQQLARNVYWSPYIGVGCNILETDLEKEYWDDETSKWESIPTLDVLGGLSIRYKRVGCFIEYHYLPYSMGGKVRKNFGRNALNTGVFFVF